MNAEEEKIEQKKEAVKKDAQGLWQSIKTFLVELLAFREDTDRDATIEAIKNDIPFKGATAWILICSIFVASIGLNANSTAVVIGAMLISPLMGPILGVGMSIAVNDIDVLKKSLINLAVMIVLSLLTAFMFFKFFPLGNQETSELLGRTQPDIRDVLIAFFGGLALIIARTKKGTIASVIFGVAIATALMPPLCTAGYGLANGNIPYFLGAMNLFTINTIFIALATFLVAKLLRFPLVRYANSKRRKRISQLASLAALIVMIYPTYTFINVLQESKIDSDYNLFLRDEVESNVDLWFQKDIIDSENKIITLYFNGEITDATRTDLQNELKKYKNIGDFELKVNGNRNRSFDKISDAYDRAISDLEEKDNIISGLQKEIETLREEINSINQSNNTFSFSNVAKDAKIRFSDLEYFGYSKMLTSSNFITVDTIDVVSAQWKKSLEDSIVKKRDAALVNWLKAQIKLDSVVIKRKQD